MMRETIVRTCAWLGSALVLAMVGIFALTGVGQDPLQFVQPDADYARLLTADPGALRACIALDNVFIVLYTTMFICLGTLVRRAGAPRHLVRVAIGVMMAVAVLDMVENVHFMVMIDRALQGLDPGDREIEFQAWESLLKFHLSYLGMFAFGCALPRCAGAQRLLADLSLVQLPIGVLIYVVPRAIATPLVFVRFTYFVVALLLAARAFGRISAGSGARGSRPGTTPGVVG